MARIPTRDATEARRKKHDAVADRFAAFRPASAVLTSVEAVPTIFPQLDHALRVGGWPVRRTALIHGPSNEGKSLLLLGLMASFVRKRHRALYLDAERTTTGEYASLVGGEGVLDARDERGEPYYLAAKPDSYEEAIECTRRFCNVMAAERKRDPEACGIVGLDSLSKLMPRGTVDEYFAEMRALEEDRAAGKEVSTKQDRLAQHCAKINKRWMNEVCQLTDKSGVSFTAIVREIQKPDAAEWEKKIGWDFILGGGRDPFFEASAVVRVERSWVYDGKGEDRTVLGERHKAVVWKTKVAGKDDKKVVSFFHTSNGNLDGFVGPDRARDVLELAERLDVVKTAGHWRIFGRKRIANGENATVKKLHVDEVLLAEIEAATRARFMAVPPVEANQDGDIVER
jgi:RecA/RadA recombinase